MYLEHFGLSEVPFRITPHTEFFFAGARRGITLDALLYAIVNDQGIVKVSGEVGSGKTMLCRVLMERLPDRVVVVYLANPSLSREDIVFAIADDLELNLPESTRASAAVRALQSKLIELHAEGRQVVVLIDEAHAMPIETLEEIRLLSNLETSQHKLLQLVLFGQPELDDILARPDMRQLKERITQHFRLEPMARADIEAYLDFRMRTAGYRGPPVFTPEAINLIATVSQGLTRRVNILAEKSLLAAFTAGKHQVALAEAQAAAQDAGYPMPAPPPSGSRISGLGLAVLLLVTIIAAVGALLITRPPMEPAAAATHAPAVPPTTAAAPAPALAPAPTAPEAQGPVPPTLSFAQDTTAALEAVAAQLQPETQQRLRDTQRWIADTPADHWFIQLISTNTQQLDYVEHFLASADRLLTPERVRLYLVNTGKEQRIGIILGDYPTNALANAAIQQLPAELRLGSPFPRQLLWLK